MRHFLTVTVVVLAAAPAWAELRIENIQACYGRLGPERKSLTCYPLEEVEFRYVIKGVRVDAAGKIDGELTMQITDPNGKELLNRKSPLAAILALGGDSLPGHASLVLPPELPAGKYTMSVSFRDNLAGESAQFQREIVLKPTEFAIASPRFYYDADGKVPAPAAGLVSETLHVKLRVIGFDRSQGKIDTDMEMEVLDSAGKSVMPNPIRAQLQNDKPDVVQKAPYLTFSGELSLNRAGDFTLRVKVNDRVGKKSAQFETPLRVTLP